MKKTYGLKSDTKNSEVEVKETENQTEGVKEMTSDPRPKKKITSVPMIKNYNGNLTVKLEPYDFSAPLRKIKFKYNQERQYVPIKWAIGVFVTDSALKQFEMGYFTFEDLELIIKMAEEEGLYVPDSIKNPSVTSKELKKLLIKNDVDTIKRKMVNAPKNRKSDLILLARSVMDKLNYSTIQYLEKEYGVTLKTVNLDD